MWMLPSRFLFLKWSCRWRLQLRIYKFSHSSCNYPAWGSCRTYRCVVWVTSRLAVVELECLSTHVCGTWWRRSRACLVI